MKIVEKEASGVIFLSLVVKIDGVSRLGDEATVSGKRPSSNSKWWRWDLHYLGAAEDPDQEGDDNYSEDAINISTRKVVKSSFAYTPRFMSVKSLVLLVSCVFFKATVTVLSVCPPYGGQEETDVSPCMLPYCTMSYWIWLYVYFSLINTSLWCCNKDLCNL